MRAPSPTADDRLREIGRTRHGAITTALAVDAGITPTMLAQRTRTGMLDKGPHGTYVVAEQKGPWTPAALVQARYPSAVLAGRGAACLWGVESFETPDPDHVIAVSNRIRAAVRPATFEPADVLLLEGLRVLEPTALMGSLGLFVDVDRLEVAVEFGLRAGLTSEAALRRWLRSHHDQGAIALQEMMDRRGWGIPPTESYLETLAVQRVFRPQGFAMTRQVEVRSETGTLMGRFDFELDAGLLVEVSGAEFHSTGVGLQRDSWRGLSLRLMGKEVEHITWQDVTGHPVSTGRRLRQRCEQLAARHQDERRRQNGTRHQEGTRQQEDPRHRDPYARCRSNISSIGW